MPKAGVPATPELPLRALQSAELARFLEEWDQLPAAIRTTGHGRR